MAAVDTLLSSPFYEFVKPTLYTRVVFGGVTEWIEKPLLHCDSITRVTGGTGQISAAQLTWHYGDFVNTATLLAGGVGDFANNNDWDPGDFAVDQDGYVYPVTNMQQFVKIVVPLQKSDISWGGETAPTSYTWYGIVTDIVDLQGGEYPDGRRYGDQKITVSGVEWLMTRYFIRESRVDGIADEVPRGIAFNDYRNDPISKAGYKRANKSKTSVTFAPDVDDADEWTGADIAEYLENQLFLSAAFGNLQFRFDNASLLTWFKPTIETHGKSVWEILAELASPRRGLTWTATLDETVPESPTIVVRFATLTGIPVALSGGATLPANDRLLDDVSSQSDITADCVVITSSQQAYEQVIAEGERIWVTATFALDGLGGASGTLPYTQEDWASSIETAYKNGLTLTGDKSDINETNDLYRSTKLEHVFTRFRVTDAGLLNGSVFGTTAQWVPGLRFARHLPSKNGYTGDYDKPLVICPVGSKYVHVTDLPRKNEKKHINGYTFSSSIDVHDHQLGFSIVPSGVPHLQADGQIVNNTDVKAELDYTDFLVTASIIANEHVTQVYPSIAETPRSEVTARLVIRVPNARWDYAIANTVYGIADNGDSLLTWPGGTTYRDDRQLLARIAKTAWQWYGRDRKSIQCAYKQILGFFEPGRFVVQHNGEDVNAIISSASWDFVQGTTSFATEFIQPQIVDWFETSQ